MDSFRLTRKHLRNPSAEPPKNELRLRLDSVCQGQTVVVRHVADLQIEAVGRGSVIALESSIPLASVRTLIYERSSKPRYAVGLLIAWPLLFTKSKQHYLTVQHASGYGVFQLPKGSYMEVLAAMEAATGKHVERHEER